ncbi:hypothetical protein AVEN_118963-1, partial [Araneus ventricosus]
VMPQERVRGRCLSLVTQTMFVKETTGVGCVEHFLFGLISPFGTLYFEWMSNYFRLGDISGNVNSVQEGRRSLCSDLDTSAVILKYDKTILRLVAFIGN